MILTVEDVEDENRLFQGKVGRVSGVTEVGEHLLENFPPPASIRGIECSLAVLVNVFVVVFLGFCRVSGLRVRRVA